MSTTTETQERLLDAGALGKVLSLSRRQVFRLNASGKLPAPIRIGGAVRWRASEITDWLLVGAPDRSTWARIKEAQR